MGVDGVSYYHPILDPATMYVHSVDRMKFRFKIKEHDVNFASLLSSMCGDVVYSYKPTALWSHLWDCTGDHGEKFCVALGKRTPRERCNDEGWIQFNPNKCFFETDDGDGQSSTVFRLLSLLQNSCKWMRIEQLDYAVDMPYKRNEVSLFRTGKSKYVLIQSEALTEYVGTAGNGYIKLYDKAAERGFKGDLVRFEITLARSIRGLNPIQVPTDLAAICFRFNNSSNVPGRVFANLVAMHQIKILGGNPDLFYSLIPWREKKSMKDVAASSMVQPLKADYLETLLKEYTSFEREMSIDEVNELVEEWAKSMTISQIRAKLSEL